jgi:hypothetical protein
MDPMFMSILGFSNGFFYQAPPPEAFLVYPIFPGNAADLGLVTLTAPISAFQVPILGIRQITVASVPEPATILLLVAGIGGIAIMNCFRRR